MLELLRVLYTLNIIEIFWMFKSSIYVFICLLLFIYLFKYLRTTVVVGVGGRLLILSER